MTEPAPDAPGPEAPIPSAGPPAPDAPRPRAAGLLRFSIEGRRAPGLFVGGWLTTVIGAGLAIIGLLSAPGLPAAILLLTGLVLLSVGFVLLGGSQTVERQAVDEPYGGPSPVLVFLAIVTTTLVVAGVVGTALDLVGVTLDEAAKPVGDLLAVVLQAAVFVGLVQLMVVAPGAISWRDMGLRIPRLRALSGLLTGAAFAVPTVFVTGVVASALVSLLGQVPPSPLPPTGTGVGTGLHLIAGAGIAPFAEEVVFRGAALTAWLRTTSPNAAIARSALLFAAAHAIGISGESFGQAFGLAVVASVVRLPVALALGWIYARTGTLWSSIGLHAAFNAILIVVSEAGIAGPTALLLG